MPFLKTGSVSTAEGTVTKRDTSPWGLCPVTHESPPGQSPRGTPRGKVLHRHPAQAPDPTEVMPVLPLRSSAKTATDQGRAGLTYRRPEMALGAGTIRQRGGRHWPHASLLQRCWPPGGPLAQHDPRCRVPATVHVCVWSEQKMGAGLTAGEGVRLTIAQRCPQTASTSTKAPRCPDGRCLCSKLYWVDQKVRSGFSIVSYRKT